MTKSDWQRHWQSVIKPHNTKTCPDCKARLKTKRATSNRRERENTLRDLGLTPVKVDGHTYWE